MKNFISVFVLVFIISVTGYSQNVAINATGTPAAPTAILDISSNSKGMLVPRMSTLERNMIVNPAQGLLVYDLDTRNFWFYDGAWNQINSGGGSLPTGPASGDLSGSYPSPNVAKIQNLDVAFGVPFDKQVLKWDALSNNWMGRNDSLFLPYNVAFGDAGKLFGIQNNNTSGGSSAICGKSGSAGSGIIPSSSMGVWGDNAGGVGVVGTSNTGIGTFGFSFGNHGVYGYSTLANFAGVCGSHANANGIGVLGDIQNSGKAIYGRSSGTLGTAGYFENTNNSNFDPTLKVSAAGNGPAGYFTTSGGGHAAYLTSTNVNNTYPLVFIDNISKGTGLSVSMSPATTSHGVYVTGQGTGTSIYSLAEMGQAGSFSVVNSNNTTSALYTSTLGKGFAAKFIKDNTTGSISDQHSPDVLIDNNSKGNALQIKSLHSPSVNCAVDVNYDGQAFGLNVFSTHGGIHTSSNSSNGWALIAEEYNGGGGVKGISNSLVNPGIQGENQMDNGVGVLGNSTTPNGIAVKGVAVCNTDEKGAVTGLNNSLTTGIGVLGETNAEEGAGVRGVSHSSSASGVTGWNDNGGEGVYGFSEGDFSVGVSGIADPTPGTAGAGVVGNNFGEGNGVAGFSGIGGYGVQGFDGASNQGGGGLFGIFYTTNTSTALKVENSGLGKSLNIVCANNSNTSTAVLVTKAGTSDYAIFEDGGGVNKIRFDNSGKGFFNGGTQTGGADMAESFAVENKAASYEPGDVLVISTESDRTVTKSSTPYSTLVAGVYATKPGVLMSEQNIETDLTDEVPMGIVGVIPTKVCLEGGAISRGDLLVTSSLPGIAMKADPEKVKFGQVIGKALENFNRVDAGLIKVLVNVK